MPQPVPVLLYHSVSEDPRPDQAALAVRPAAMRAHLDALRRAGAVGISVDDLVGALRDGTPLPDRAVAITFDDGVADQLGAAATFAEAGFPAIVYVATGFVGQGGYLDHAMLHELASVDGVEVGAHSVSHLHLDLLTDDELGREVESSRTAIEQTTQRRVRHFAYPYGSHRTRERDHLERAGWSSGAAVKNAFTHLDDDPFAFARVTITAATTPADIANLVAGRGAPLAWRRERVRTKAFRHVRRVRQRRQRLEVHA
jgi:peptidoglycan/xylan/chitin deacetylase (PgdA/CDA1 family)